MLKIEVPPEGKPVPGTKALPRRSVLCWRVDLEDYVEMDIRDLHDAGLLKRADQTGDELDKQAPPL